MLHKPIFPSPWKDLVPLATSLLLSNHLSYPPAPPPTTSGVSSCYPKAWENAPLHSGKWWRLKVVFTYVACVAPRRPENLDHWMETSERQATSLQCSIVLLNIAVCILSLLHDANLCAVSTEEPRNNPVGQDVFGPLHCFTTLYKVSVY